MGGASWDDSSGSSLLVTVMPEARSARRGERRGEYVGVQHGLDAGSAQP